MVPRHNKGLFVRLVVLTIAVTLFAACDDGQPTDYFVLEVVDDATGRGVPLVELRLPNDVRYWTDSAGIVALNEPSLRDREVFIRIRSDGYEFLKDTPFGRGFNAEITPGKMRQVALHRTMIAERLYRLTGTGIYRDSVMAGLAITTDEPLPPAEVLGQDSVVGTLYRGKIFWAWGDTVGPNYWNFAVSAATSELSDDPAVGVNYTHFTDPPGRLKEMLPLAGEGLVWIEGLIPMKGPKGQERLIATYTRQDGLEFPEECGLALFNDALEIFRPWIEYPCRTAHYSSHPFLHDDYLYLQPWLRVPNNWAAIQDVTQWQDREVQWPPNATRPSGVVWNEYRQRWILLLERSGDVYYAEASSPEGPYGDAVKIIHHNEYNFYNVATHTFFNQEGGGVIYLEGTYTDSFTAAPEKTPRYNYNQVMYRLRLDDPRLAAAQE